MERFPNLLESSDISLAQTFPALGFIKNNFGARGYSIGALGH